MTRFVALACGLLPLAPEISAADAGGMLPTKTPWADWIEPGFPFVSSVVDARKVGAESIADNLTPRGIVVNLGGDAWACFDTELLRVSAVWRGHGVTMLSGSDRMLPGSVHLSKDRKSVFVGLADMRADVMQMHVNWSLRARDGTEINHAASFTPQELVAFRPEAEGFGPVKVRLQPSPTGPAEPAASQTRPSIGEGRRLYNFLGCMACHTVDDSTSKGLGPNWKSLFGSERPLADGGMVVADEAYLRESILSPGARIVKGYENGMPMYAGIVTDAQVESIILFIKSLR